MHNQGCMTSFDVRDGFLATNAFVMTLGFVCLVMVEFISPSSDSCSLLFLSTGDRLRGIETGAKTQKVILRMTVAKGM